MELEIGRKRKLVLHLGRGIENPAWDYVRELPPDDLHLRFGESYPTTFEEVDGVLIPHRSRVTSRWTWAIPSPAVLEFFVKTLDGRPVVELGAGNGYWAWMLSQYGIDVNAYDIAPLEDEESWFKTSLMTEHGWDAGVKAEKFHLVKRGSVEVLAEPENADRVLFLCWPNYNTDFAYEAVKAFRGDTVIYIGEGAGGCNADDQFFALMTGEDYRWSSDDEPPLPDQEWEEVAFQSMTQWAGMHDNVYVYRRKS